MRKAPSNINNLFPYVERISLSFPRDPAEVQWQWASQVALVRVVAGVRNVLVLIVQ